MILNKISPHLTIISSDEEDYQLKKSLLISTTSRSWKNAQERYQIYSELEEGINAKATKFMKENLGFGDKSIAEPYVVDLEYDNVPCLFSMRFLACPFLSPIESSTRYIKVPKDHFYKYEVYQHDKDYDKYLTHCRGSLEIYNRAFDYFNHIFLEKFPLESIDWGQDLTDEQISKSYNSALKSKIADTVKIFLPMSTLTNFACSINARALEEWMASLLAYSGKNANIHRELLDPLYKYCTEGRLAPLFTHFDKTLKAAEAKYPNHMTLNLIDQKINWETDNIVSCYLTPHLNIPKNVVPRQSRHDKISSIYKYNIFHFDIISSLAAYRDMNRHRMVEHDIEDILWPIQMIPSHDMLEHGNEFLKDYESLNMIYDIKHFVLRTSGLPMGAKIQWRMLASVYDIVNIVELRSGKGGYWEYIELAREMAEHVGMDDKNLFQHADFTTDPMSVLPTLRTEMKKVS